MLDALIGSSHLELIRERDGLKNRSEFVIIIGPAIKNPQPQVQLGRGQRDQESQKKTLLKILPGNFAGDIKVVKAELVGNYAIQMEWSDGHGSGIYSFQYLRDISPKPHR